MTSHTHSMWYRSFLTISIVHFVSLASSSSSSSLLYYTHTKCERRRNAFIWNAAIYGPYEFESDFKFESKECLFLRTVKQFFFLFSSRLTNPYTNVLNRDRHRFRVSLIFFNFIFILISDDMPILMYNEEKIAFFSPSNIPNDEHMSNWMEAYASIIAAAVAYIFNAFPCDNAAFKIENWTNFKRAIEDNCLCAGLTR